MSMLLSPAKIAKMDLKNRVVLSPVRTYRVQAGDGCINPMHMAHYGARAVEQVGLVMIEMTAVEPDGRTTDSDLGLWNQQQARELKKLVTFLHSLGAKVGIQLGHAGRKAKDAGRVVAPSRSEPYRVGYQVPAELNLSELRKIQRDFVAAVKRAVTAGVDMIELQGAEGYLIDEFFSPILNRRCDEYGGSLKKRYRFIHEIIALIREFYQGSLWVRLSLDDYAKDDEQNKLSEWKQVGKWLEQDGIDCLSITTGGLFNKQPHIKYEGWQVDYARTMKQAVDIPVAAVGMLRDSNFCEYILETKQADLVLAAQVFDDNASWLVDSRAKLDSAE